MCVSGIRNIVNRINVNRINVNRIKNIPDLKTKLIYGTSGIGAVYGGYNGATLPYHYPEDPIQFRIGISTLGAVIGGGLGFSIGVFSVIFNPAFISVCSIGTIFGGGAYLHDKYIQPPNNKLFTNEFE